MDTIRRDRFSFTITITSAVVWAFPLCVRVVCCTGGSGESRSGGRGRAGARGGGRPERRGAAARAGAAADDAAGSGRRSVRRRERSVDASPTDPVCYARWDISLLHCTELHCTDYWTSCWALLYVQLHFVYCTGQCTVEHFAYCTSTVH